MVKLVLGAELLTVVVREIKAAESSVRVAMFEWSWYPGQHTGSVQDINRELCIRGRDGCDVKVLLHNEAMGRALHRINRVTAGHLRQSKVLVKWGNTGAPLHAKVWIFDGARAVLGSHNISVRATRTNHEVSVLLDEPEEMRRLVEWFDALWAKGM